MKLEATSEEAAAARQTVQSLMQDNACLKTLLQSTSEENQRILEETTLKLETQVIIQIMLF